MSEEKFRELSAFFVSQAPIVTEQFQPQCWGTLQFNLDVMGKSKVRIGGKEYENGLGCHLPSRIRIRAAQPVKSFTAVCGYAENAVTERFQSEKYPQIYSVEANGRKLYESQPLAYGEAESVRVEFPEGTHEFFLNAVGVKGDTMGHAAWGTPVVELPGGERLIPTPAGDSFGKSFPVSFQYGTVSSAVFFGKNPLKVAETQTEKELQRVFTADNGEIKVTVTMTLRHDLPVWEWHTEFENVSNHRSQNLSRVRVFTQDKALPVAEKFDFVRRRGAVFTPNPNRVYTDMFRGDYAAVQQNCGSPFEVELNGGPGGRPSEEWLPYFDLSDGKSTIRAVIGWAGNWAGHFSSNGILAQWELGLGDFDSYLEPGEKVSMPSVYLVVADGDTENAANIWRRFLKKYIMRSAGGKTPEPAMPVHHWGGMSADDQLRALDMLEKANLPFDIYWIDAGWYAPRNVNEFEFVWAQHTGDWDFCKDTYPEELTELSRRLHERGKKLLLWFEPERVVRISNIFQAHPEYFIDRNEAELLLDLGNPRAWQWCFDKIAGVLRRNRIDWCRIDFNFSPLRFWRTKDEPGRKGMSEVRYVEGLYRFWKALKTEFPELMIDNCASGGCRLDVELLRYSVPMTFSDMFCDRSFDPEYALEEIGGMADYCPMFGAGDGKMLDTYQFRASFTSFGGCHFAYTFNDLEKSYTPEAVQWYRDRLQEALRIRRTLTGDFYRLSPVEPLSGRMWTIYQYDLPEENQGTVLLFRSEKSPVCEIDLILRGLEPDALYQLADVEGVFKEQKLSGAELMTSGIKVRLEKRRSSDIICYRKVK